MLKKFGLFLLVVVVLVLGGALIVQSRNSDEPIKSPLSPLGKKLEETVQKAKYDSDLVNKNRINILLFGIDRRHKGEGYRTDIMILLSADRTTNKVVMTSVPRDLWWEGERINAIYSLRGWEEMQTAFGTITALTPDRYVLIDFEDFKWLVDAMGGVPVNIETTFTDTQYPVDATFEYQTVNFTQGTEKLSGERALIFARSRKGDFDNGDWGRMKRQHLILKGMLEGVVQPESIFNPVVIEKAYATLTGHGIETNLTIDDAKFLWDFYKDKDKYEVNSLLVDYDYLYTPPAADYGGAWVLAPIDNDYTKIKNNIETLLTTGKMGEITTTQQQIAN